MEEFHNAKTLSYAASAAKVLSADSALSTASIVWSGDSLPGSGKTKLASGEMETIDQMFAGCTTDDQKKAKAAQLVKDTPLLRDVLKITVKYREFLPAEEADAD